MRHPPPRIRVDDDLELRLTDLDDVEESAALVRANLDHLRPWMPWASSSAAGDVEAMRRRRLESAQEAEAGSDYSYRLLLRGVHIGMVGLHRRIGPGAIEIGYWLSADHTGRGCMTRAVIALTAEAMNLEDVERVEIHCDQANVASARVPERAGYRLDRVEEDGMVWVFPP